MAEITGSFYGNTSGPASVVGTYKGDPSSLIIIPTVGTFNGDASNILMRSGEAIQHSGVAKRWVIGALRGISLGGPTCVDCDGTFGRHLTPGVTQSMSDGNPSAPCLKLEFPSFWRFRWVVKAGSRTVSVNAKQTGTILTSSLRPTVVVKANPNIGLNADISGSAVASQGWVTIGPVSFIATTSGVTWVELHNNNTNEGDTPTYFDHIVVM